MEFGVILKNGVIIGAILGVVALSQSSIFGPQVRDFVYNHSPKVVTDSFKTAGNWMGNFSLKGSSATQTIEPQEPKQGFFDGIKTSLAEKVIGALGVKGQNLSECK